MSRALSLDLRVRVLAEVAAGLSHRAATRFGVSAASVGRWQSALRIRALRAETVAPAASRRIAG